MFGRLPTTFVLLCRTSLFSDDLLHDDLGKFAMDVIELSSKLMILDISYVLCPLQNMGIAGSR